MYSYLILAMLSITLMACTSSQPDGSSSSEANDSLLSTSSNIPDTMSTESNAHRNDQRVRGVDFLALGNEPFWSLEIDFDSMMHFKSMTQVDSIHTAVPEASQAQDAPVTRYRAETEDGELTVTISQQTCSDAMSGEEFPYSVRIRAKTGEMDDFEEFSGCGLYLGDYRLNDIWALETLNGETVDTAQFPRDQPYIEIHLAEQKILGFAGCNSISGAITFGKSSIQVGPLISTRMSCPAQEFEQNFMQALSDKTLTCTLENGQLVLESRNGRLGFKKVD
ncbi:MAG: META domain-containing protein [Cyclobacteriaceae bacterium]